jgi:uncharacterized protein YbbC (DUF1343 family)
MKFPHALGLAACAMLFFYCGQSEEHRITESTEEAIASEETVPQIQVGAERTEEYLFLLKDKSVGLIVNQTSMIGGSHLVDSLLGAGINVTTIFAPEHGFRGTADAGATIVDGKDEATGIPIISLYGNNKKPSAAALSGLDILVFDIQDVGARFYTYISTMTYVMQACAENNKPLLVLDRPNPNGHYVDGPILDPNFSSFVGLHQVPVVHGMTIAEYANMVNGEGWLPNGLRCDLNYVLCKNYNHNTPYSLPVKPSPNLPNDDAIRFYPSLCFFEGTVVSVGRGTDAPFQIFGHPDFPESAPFTFTPESTSGASNPKLNGKLCRGYDLRENQPAAFEEGKLNLNYLITAYQDLKGTGAFFNSNGFFDLLAGGDELRKQIEAGLTEEEIRLSWRDGLNAFNEIRSKYLLYKDFE